MKKRQVFFLDRRGDVIGSIGELVESIDSKTAFPIVVDYYDWDLNKQMRSAEKYKD